MPLTPKNRKEEWLQGLVDHETTLTPKNRPEEWMKEIIDASGGGGGIDLGITGASVGEYAKIKTVDADGVPTAWESGTGGGGVLVVGLDGEPMTLNKTWQEIKNAYDANMVVMLPTDGLCAYLGAIRTTETYDVYFTSLDGTLMFQCANTTDYPVYVE